MLDASHYSETHGKSVNLFARSPRTDLSTTATKKVYLFNKRLVHMTETFFGSWDSKALTMPKLLNSLILQIMAIFSIIPIIAIVLIILIISTGSN